MTAPEKCPHCGGPLYPALARLDEHNKHVDEIAKLKARVAGLERMLRCYNFWGRQSLPEEKP